MKVLEIFRLLPRTNCGKCRYGRCMPLAVALATGEAGPDECPELTPESRAELAQGEGEGDWRRALIRELAREVSALSLAGSAPGLGADIRDGCLSLTCLGVRYLVHPDGTVASEAPLHPWQEILILHYVRTGGGGPPAGRWVSFADLRNGLVKSTSFQRECVEPLRQLFGREPDHLAPALEGLGGRRQEGQDAPVAWVVPALPRVPLLLLYWPPEEEFDAKFSVLFDASADRFLDVESLTFLTEGLVRALESGPGAAPHD